MSPRPLFSLGPRDKALVAGHLATAALHDDSPAAALRLMAGAGVVSGTGRKHCLLLADRLDAGDRLSTALAAHPRSFDRHVVGLVAAGEESGSPRGALAAWAALASERRRRGALAVSSLGYPACILGIAAATMGMALYKVVPTFSTLYLEAGREFPLSTQVAIASAHWLKDVAALLPIAVVILVALWFLIRGTRARLAAHRLVLLVPLVGTLVRGRARCVTLAILAAFVKAGRGLPEGLRHAAEAQGNAWVAHVLQVLAARLDAGEELPLTATDGLDGATLHAIRASLAASDPGAALDRLASRQASALERQSARWRATAPSLVLVSLFLPFAMLLAGLYAMLFGVPALVP